MFPTIEKPGGFSTPQVITGWKQGHKKVELLFQALTQDAQVIKQNQRLLERQAQKDNQAVAGRGHSKAKKNLKKPEVIAQTSWIQDCMAGMEYALMDFQPEFINTAVML